MKVVKPEKTKCDYCGRKIEGSQITEDHILAKIRGGLSTPDNIAWACPLCNMMKSDMSYEEFKMVIKGLSKEDLKLLRTFPLPDPTVVHANKEFDWKGFKKIQSTIMRSYNRRKKLQLKLDMGEYMTITQIQKALNFLQSK
jgi:hypothetical protein